jgi:hypothetical protein
LLLTFFIKLNIRAAGFAPRHLNRSTASPKLQVRMIKQIFIIIFICFLAISARNQSLQTDQRNLNDYDKISFDIPVSESPYSAVAKARSFIWEHWQQHRKGYVILKLRNKHGELTTSQTYIEPNENGEWRVVIHTKSELRDRRLLNDPKRTGKILYQTRSFEAYEVEQVKIKNKDYFLRYKDKNGKVLTER